MIVVLWSQLGQIDYSDILYANETFATIVVICKRNRARLLEQTLLQFREVLPPINKNLVNARRTPLLLLTRKYYHITMPSATFGIFISIYCLTKYTQSETTRGFIDSYINRHY